MHFQEPVIYVDVPHHFYPPPPKKKKGGGVENKLASKMGKSHVFFPGGLIKKKKSLSI